MLLQTAGLLEKASPEAVAADPLLLPAEQRERDAGLDVPGRRWRGAIESTDASDVRQAARLRMLAMSSVQFVEDTRPPCALWLPGKGAEHWEPCLQVVRWRSS
jgi:hypothetical protein